jgi:hypothetical protein
MRIQTEDYDVYPSRFGVILTELMSASQSAILIYSAIFSAPSQIFFQVLMGLTVPVAVFLYLTADCVPREEEDR